MGASAVRGQQRAIAAELLLKINYAPDHFNSPAVGKIFAYIAQKRESAKPNECVKIEKQAEIIVATLRLISKHQDKFAIDSSVAKDLECWADTAVDSDLAKRNDVRNASIACLTRLGMQDALKSFAETKEEKEKQRQARRDAKREKQEAKKLRFEQIKKEKIEKGEWLEKSQWKSLE